MTRETRDLAYDLLWPWEARVEEVLPGVHLRWLLEGWSLVPQEVEWMPEMAVQTCHLLTAVRDSAVSFLDE